MKQQLITKEWRLLNELSHLDPYWNLAVEDAVRLTVEKRSVPNTLRFWRNRNTVHIGRFQCPKLEINFPSLLKYKTNLSRRFTGGGAVYHDDGNLNFAISKFIYPYQKSSFSTSIFFKKIGLTVVKALKTLGIHAELKKTNIFIGNQKLSGLAGLVTKKSIFVHGCILVHSNLKILSHVLNYNKKRVKKKFVRSSPSKVTNIENVICKEIQMKEMKAILVNAFKEEFTSHIIKGELTKEEINLAKKLFKEKYNCPSWIFSTCLGCQDQKKDASILSDLSNYKHKFYKFSELKNCL